MTELIFHTDSYAHQFTAAAAAADGNVVLLDRTAFFPGGGGQPGDGGTLSWGEQCRQIVGYQRRDGEAWLVLDGPAPPPGQTLTGAVDWGFRYRMMRTHTALHILCGVIFRDYGALVTGGNMTAAEARMDFELEHMSERFAAEVEERIGAEVQAARDVRVRILPREEAFRIPDLIRTKINLLPPGIAQVRIVEIVGLDMQADGGTHVANTREVGRISVVGHESKGRINKRLRIALT